MFYPRVSSPSPLCYSHTALQLSVLLRPCLIHAYISRSSLPGLCLLSQNLLNYTGHFGSQEKRLRVLYLPGFLPILLHFSPLFLSSSGVSHRISEYPGLFHHGRPGPGPGPRPADLQHGGRGHWEGGCSAPTHTAAFTTLPRECLPCLPGLPVPRLAGSDPGCLLGHHETILLLLLPVSVHPAHMGVLQARRCLPWLFTVLAPQLSKGRVAPLFSSGPSLSRSMGLSWGETPSCICTPAFSPRTDHWPCLLSPWSSALCLCPQERKGSTCWR